MPSYQNLDEEDIEIILPSSPNKKPEKNKNKSKNKNKNTNKSVKTRNFQSLFGKWKPNMAKDNINNEVSLSELEKQWIQNFSNQVFDLENLLDEATKIITKQFLKKQVTLIYKGNTFIIEMLKKYKESEQLENNIYLKGNKIPIYTENITDEKSEVLGNFWISFMEHGFKHI